MRSVGTKATQGINGDAAALQRRLDAAARFQITGDAAVCAYRAHRGQDWRLASGGPVVCGICHPPAGGPDVERVTVTGRKGGNAYRRRRTVPGAQVSLNPAVVKPCPRCHGTGERPERSCCATCGGTGHVTRVEAERP